MGATPSPYPKIGSPQRYQVSELSEIIGFVVMFLLGSITLESTSVIFVM